MAPAAPDPGAIAAAAELIATSLRPAIIAGRGAVLAGAGPELERLGEMIGAVLATSAPANGLFAGPPLRARDLGRLRQPVRGIELLPQADVVLVVGASVNHWTTKHGALIDLERPGDPDRLEPRAIGRNRPADLAIIGDATARPRRR